MSTGLLNWAMLAGLAGLALPVLVHLLSRQRYDVVQWGAMQFLELGHRTKRRIRLEELLLLLLRMATIAILVFALARPWVSGGWLARFMTVQNRDIVLVVDGSYSMGWEGKAVTPHAAAIQGARHFLDDLHPGDTVALLDARESPRPALDVPTRDFATIRQRLDALPAPAGAADLPAAIAASVRSLSRAGNLSREVIVLTDGAAYGWHAVDAARWEVLDDLRAQQSISPRLWVVDFTDSGRGDRTNFSLEPLQMSREFTAVNLPVRVRTKLRYTGGQAPIQRKVYLEVDGQRLAEATLLTPLLQPGGEFSVEFEHRFASAGSHLISVVLDNDNLPGDNRAEAAITVADAIPVLLVDGDPQLDRSRSETFFAQAALTAAENESPLVRARVIDGDRLMPPDLDGVRVVVLANVRRITAALGDALAEHVAAGGGLLVSLGDKVDAAAYNQVLFRDGAALLPAALDAVRADEGKQALGVRVLDGSLTLPLVTPFRREQGGGLTEARFTQWWHVDAQDKAKAEGERLVGGDLPAGSPPVVAARFDNGDPYLVLRSYGRGRVVLLAAPLDSDGSTLPAKPDYVPFLHELIFHLAGGAAPSRNLQVGQPLILPVAADFPAEGALFRGPGGTELPAHRDSGETGPTRPGSLALRLDEALLPGVYTLVFAKKGAQDVGPRPEHFVVNCDRSESDLTPLDDKDRGLLTRHDRLRFARTTEELKQQMFADGPRTEVWRFLILLLLGVLVCELWLTRRLVRGGHAVE